eukprot:gene15033-18203_t
MHEYKEQLFQNLKKHLKGSGWTMVKLFEGRGEIQLILPDNVDVEKEFNQLYSILDRLPDIDLEPEQVIISYCHKNWLNYHCTIINPSQELVVKSRKKNKAEQEQGGDGALKIDADKVIAGKLLTAQQQAAMAPETVLEILKKGNQQFLESILTVRNNSERIRLASLGQYPLAVVLSCLDSRVPVEDVFHLGMGDIFVARVAGNVVNEDILGSLEYACKVSGSKVIVVLGHEHCGAIKSAIDDVKLGNITSLLTKIKPAVLSSENFPGEKTSSNAKYVHHVCEQNVKLSVARIRENSPILKEMEDQGGILIVGAVYDMSTGKVCARPVEEPVKEKIKALNKKAKSLNRDSTNQAIAYAYQAYLLAYENKLKEQQAEAMVILAEGYLYNDIYDLALEYAFNTLEIYKEKGSGEQIAATYTLLGWIYYDVENAELALKYHSMAYDLYHKAGNENKAAISLNGIGLSWQLKNEFVKASGYFEKVLHLAEQHHNQALMSAAYDNLGISSNNIEQYNQAINYFQLALKYSTGQVLSLAEVHNQMAFSMLKLGRYDQAQLSLDAARKYIDQSTSNSKKENLLDNYKVSSQLDQLRGNYKAAYENIQKYNAIREEFLSKNKVNALLTLTMKREAQEKERQIKALSLEKVLKSYQRNTLAIIVVLLVIIGFLLYTKLRSRQKKNAELAELKQQALSNKLEFNNTELKNYALYEINMEKYVEDFNLQIESKYQDFFYNLQRQFPSLTQNERRLCAQIRLNLSIKEIASLNNISVKSAEMARYRLRKHFALNPSDNLNDFLKSF